MTFWSFYTCKVYFFLFFTTWNLTLIFYFFFQAEDGIRDYKVTGVQTCALPISPWCSGFEVTQQNQNTKVSEHFKLKDFLPHDQGNVWPKYIVLDMKLIDKDELDRKSVV